MNIWFTSDQHYFHRNILKYCDRPFKDVDDMTEGLIERHNSVVGTDDFVYNLGDFSLSDNKVSEVLKRLNGIQILIPGNHDRCHPAHRKFRKEDINNYHLYGFRDIQELHREFYHTSLTEPVEICHMPYSQDERHKERYSQYRPVDNGKWLLHGHIHQLWQINDKQINVGVDVWDYKPVHLSQIVEIIRDYYTRDNEGVKGT